MSITLAARIAQVAIVAALLHGLGGANGATEALRRRAGTALDPDLVEVLRGRGKSILGVLAVSDPVSAAVGAEPQPVVRISSADLDGVCRAFGEVVDLKTPLRHGHSTGVAELAASAGQRCGLPDVEVTQLRRAALVHDLGRAAIPNGIWEPRGALSWTDQERIRLHAYHGERVLARCGPLAPLAPIAGMYHERLDGSGYHRQATASAIALPARLLAAADAFQAIIQVRAHRPARSGRTGCA